MSYSHTADGNRWTFPDIKVGHAARRCHALGRVKAWMP
jgi:hypothetical protein